MTRCVSAGEPGAEVSGKRVARWDAIEEEVDTAGFWISGFNFQGKTVLALFAATPRRQKSRCAADRRARLTQVFLKLPVAAAPGLAHDHQI